MTFPSMILVSKCLTATGHLLIYNDFCKSFKRIVCIVYIFMFDFLVKINFIVWFQSLNLVWAGLVLKWENLMLGFGNMFLVPWELLEQMGLESLEILFGAVCWLQLIKRPTDTDILSLIGLSEQMDTTRLFPFSWIID